MKKRQGSREHEDGTDRLDPAYALWFLTMLELTAPIGVVSAFGDMAAPDDRMITDFCEDGIVVALPPVWGGR